MGDRLLITQSLLSAWGYQFTDFHNIYSTNEKAEQAAQKAREDFLSSLRREPIATSPAMQKGRDFEELVVLLAEGGDIAPDKPHWEKWVEGAAQIADRVRGGAFQVASSAPVTIGDIDFLLYGRLDALKNGTIYDIKFASRYEYGNYFESAQHPMYFAIVPEAHTFTYLVYREGLGVFDETYRRSDTRDIADTISEFMEHLKKTDLFSVYEGHWKARSE